MQQCNYNNRYSSHEIDICDKHKDIIFFINQPTTETVFTTNGVHLCIHSGSFFRFRNSLQKF